MKDKFSAFWMVLLSDPLNGRICNWALGIGAILYFGSIIVKILIR
jgi:hypothetical protein